jgi:hypothetical protein
MFNTFKELVELEKDTLQTIIKINEFAAFSSELYAEANKFRQLNEFSSLDLHYSIKLKTRLRGDTSVVERMVHLGVLAQKDAASQLANASYSLVICEDASDKSKIIRKFHFDFEHASLRSEEAKPSMHLQICGRLNPHLTKMGYVDGDIQGMHPSFEKPRIPTIPMSLGLLINWILLEFGCDVTANRIMNNDDWKRHILKVERLVLKPYFKSAYEFLNGTGNNTKSFFSEKLYEITD